MNEETVLETEIQTDPTTEPFTAPTETETSPPDDGSVIEETSPETTVSESAPEETFPEESYPEETVEMTTEPLLVDVIESVGYDIVHTNLFGSFLICGTLIGLALLRKIYGT